jgi:hypothetical protein
MPAKILKLSAHFKERKSIPMENHILIGLGGRGGSVIRAFRKRIYTEFNRDERQNLPIGYLYVDASEEMMEANDPKWKIFGENTQIGKSSQLYLRGASLRAQLDNVDSYPNIKNWIGQRRIWDNIVEGIADDGAAGQRRRLGRFLFACKAQEFTTILKNQVQTVREQYNTAEVTFHVVGGLAGGTGSGSIIDVIAQIRKLYPRNDTGPRFRILVYAFMPEESPKPGWDKGYYHANGYAALMELNALSVGKFNLSDVTGQTESIDFKGSVIFDGCYLYSNLNENGIIVDNEEQLPTIVSDFLIQKIVMPVGSEAVTHLRRAEANENLADTFEYDEDKPNQERVRSFRFLGFGIKRIEIPEEEIIEYLTYNLSRQVLLQFKYNNWSDDLGFRDDAKTQDFHSYVTDNDRLRAWLLSDNHLTLSLPILDDDRKGNWKTIQEDWNEKIVTLKQEALAAAGQDSSLNKLAGFCDERFNKTFRKNGVVEFYRIKSLSVKNIAKAIRNNFEKIVFEEWRSGKRAINEVAELVEILVSHLEGRLEKVDTELNQIEQTITRNLSEKAKLQNEDSKLGFWGTRIGRKKPKIFDLYGQALQQLYIAKTNKEAWTFGKLLLASTINEFRELGSTLRTFSGSLNDMIDQAEKLINVRCQDKTFGIDALKESQIKYYEVKKVEVFKDRIIKDSKIQNEQASKIRSILVDKIGSEPTFSKMYEKVSAQILLDTLENNCQDYAITTHNDIITDKKQKIIGLNIVEKLYEEYSGNPDGLNEFVRNIIRFSGTFLNFDGSELLRTLKNNPLRTNGQTIKIETIIVRIPATPDKKEFVERLKAAFKNAVSGSKNLHFDEHTGGKKNEITIISLANGFPIRVVGEAKILKDKYDITIKREDENVARLVLHMEGDGTNYLPLFLPSREEKAKANKKMLETALPSVLLAHSMDIIRQQDRGDGSGKMIYGMATIDEFGMVNGLEDLGLKIIDAEETLTESIAVKITAEVTKNLSSEYLHQTKRQELKAKIVGIIGKVLAECNNNSNNSTYLAFQKAARAAIESLQLN